MEFPLLRLPFVALKEVIRSLDYRGIFSLPLISERSENLLKATIPKKSLHVYSTMNYDLEFKIQPENFDGPRRTIPYEHYVEDMDVEFSRKGHFVVCSRNFTHDLHKRDLFHWIRRTLNTPFFHLRFEGHRTEIFILEIVRACEQRNCLKSLSITIDSLGAKTLREVLHSCQLETQLEIYTIVRRGFRWNPPPGGLKFDSFTASNAHWVHLDHLLQCRAITAIEGIEHMTPQYLNEFFKKMMSTECRVETMSLTSESFETIDFGEVVDGLSNRPIRLNGIRQEVEIRRYDGMQLVISLSGEQISMVPE